MGVSRELYIRESSVNLIWNCEMLTVISLSLLASLVIVTHTKARGNKVFSLNLLSLSLEVGEAENGLNIRNLTIRSTTWGHVRDEVCSKGSWEPSQLKPLA